MESNEVQDVRVMEIVPNYTNTIKIAAVGAVATVLVTAFAETMVAALKVKVNRARLRKKNSGNQDHDITKL